MTDSKETRHLSWENLKEYLDAGSPGILRIHGTPQLYLIIEPVESRIAIRGPWERVGELPELIQYRYFDINTGTGKTGDWIEFGVTGQHILGSAYPLLTSIADHILDDSMEIGQAIGEVVDSYHDLLSSLVRLSASQEIGLFGELLVLEELIDWLGADRAVECWRGPLWGEHDFSLPNFDMEVKTTTQSDRKHRISSAVQLEPTVGRPLWLVSVQLRTAGIEAPTLARKVKEVEAQLPSPQTKAHYDRQLRRIGWSHEDRMLYSNSYHLRNEILVYQVGPDFPGLTESRLMMAGVGFERLSDISYTLNITGLLNGIPLGDLKGECDE